MNAINAPGSLTCVTSASCVLQQAKFALPLLVFSNRTVMPPIKRVGDPFN